MGVLGDNGWCFCSGGGKSERIKGSIFSGKAPSMASIYGGDGGGGGRGTGFLVHRSLLLTTHANIPSVAAAEAAEVRIHHGRVLARLVPHRFFISSSVLDLTIVGLDTVDSDSTSQGNQPHYLKTCCNSSLDLGNVVYLLGHTDENELMVGEGRVVIATDNLIKLSTDGVTWCPGSAGFDAQGNLAFMVCDPMKLATSPIAKSSSASSSSSLSGKKDSPMQFGIPIPIVRDWLHQNWEGSLDEVSKPKLPIIRLMSTGQRSEHSCASFTHRQVFKPTEGDENEVSSSSQVATKFRFQLGSSNSANVSHEQGIPTPEIYECPKLTSGPVRRTEIAPIHHLDINFPPKVPTSIVLPLPLKQLLMNSDENNAKECRPTNIENFTPEAGREADLVGSYQGDCCSEVHSSSSPLGISERQNKIDGFSSGEETMYSAETMESRNIPSPRENKSQQVGRSQSCMTYNRWTSDQRNSAARKGAGFQKQQAMIPVKKARSQAAPLPQRRHDFYSPTVSSSMKKRNSTEQPVRPRSVVLVTPRRNW
ncbi:uncharacterized protein M6B38_379890 [Iris pallida]|uniref:Uncharacterized protein n=1 Tax=Iris pallida TaxID=29817 RepID=A0AAX6G9G8_IRIPA|nr:uncharacterized protein M6B38_193465 [Iris pallida]KAJ6824881.1 uncharacterized protein M6B38_379890 [Iris pallida]